MSETTETEDKRPRHKRKSIPLQSKLAMLDMFKEGKRTCDVAKTFGLNESTVRTIRLNEEKIRSRAATGVTTYRTRSTIMDKMEQELFEWIQENLQKQLPLDSIIIKKKALEIFESMKESNKNSSYIQFVASKGWFENFRKRFSLSKCKSLESDDQEMISIDIDGENYFSELVDENDYLAQPIFHETDLLEQPIDKVEDPKEGDEKIEEFPIEILKEGLDLAQQLDSFFTLNDPSCERASLFKRDLYQCLSPYLELYRQLRQKSKPTAKSKDLPKPNHK